jgi:PncC family amidohydrolase
MPMLNPLAQQILDALKKKGATLAIAESCTGGLLTSLFTDQPGSSQVIQGGIIAYQDHVKVSALSVPKALIQQHTAVSQPVAEAMAQGVAKALQASFSLATTGHLPPAPDAPEGQLGRVFISFLTPKGIWTSSTITSGSRLEAKQQLLELALQMCLTHLDL